MITIIGIDNGSTGQIGIVNEHSAVVLPMPVKKELSYTKNKQWVSRVDYKLLKDCLSSYATVETKCLIERPFTGPAFKTVCSAVRCMEATLICLEELGIAYEFIDSKEWQKALLPKGLRKQELKLASLSVAKRIFPQINFDGLRDADGLLLAYYGRQKYGFEQTLT